jgi:regulator of protease activity HflC (stomatin/prohibitin superfamily)
MDTTTIILLGLIIVAFYIIVKAARVVPQKSVFLVERLGKYHTTLDAGFHLIIPVIDKVAYRHSLKEVAIDVPPQACITKDNIQVEVDGVLYFQIVDPIKVSYGISDYRFATIQLAQTTLRSLIGKIDLDKTFEERERINAEVVSAVDHASEPWGLKVTRYEIKNIIPPSSIRDAMEKQMRAEREKRALIAESEGDKQAKINRAEGDKQDAILRSEGEKMKRINEADGRSKEIEMVAMATSNGIREIAKAINEPGGSSAVNLRIAEQYLNEFGKLAQKNNTMIIPSNLADVSTLVGTVSKIFSSMQTAQSKEATKAT